MKRLFSIVASLLLFSTAATVLAQDATPAADSTSATTSAPAIPKAPGKVVEWRIKNQHKRIHAGVKAKKITQDEAKDLKSKLEDIQKQFKADIVDNKKAGVKKLTDDQYNQLKQMLDDNSKAIKDDKNDGETDANAAPAVAAPAATPSN